MVSRGGEAVRKLVGKAGKVGGKMEFCTKKCFSGVVVHIFCTTFCGGFARGNTQGFTQKMILVRCHRFSP